MQLILRCSPAQRDRESLCLGGIRKVMNLRNGNAVTGIVERSTKEGSWVAVGYFGVYLASLFVTLESESAHWLTLVLFPLVLATAFEGRGRAGSGRLSQVLGSLGLVRGNLGKGLWWSVGLGLLLSGLQVAVSARADAVWQLIVTGKALYLFPLTFILMLLTAGFTEEFFFRGFLQSRIATLTRSNWAAVPIVALCFGVYHLPYAYFNTRWPSAGDWGLAWQAALGNGIPGGLLLGAMFVLTRGNTLACVVLHALINTAPAMTMIKFSGS